MATTTRPDRSPEGIKQTVAGQKYGTSMVPWRSVGISMGFSSDGPCFACLGCGYGGWVQGHSRRANIEALEQVLAHVLTCPKQPQDTPIMEQYFTAPGPSGAVILAKGTYAMVTGDCSDDAAKALHDREEDT